MLPILHHYPTSPYGELVRTALGMKGLAWGSVIVPNILPKPGQTELTGGYARTPVLQIGADIYCDTAAILPALEALQPSPSFYPAPLGAIHRMLAAWAGGPQFLAHVGAAMGALPPGALPPGFAEDRRARFGLDMTRLAEATPHLTGQAAVAAAWLESTLADGRAFVGGAAAGHGDLGFYCNLWFVAAMAGDTAGRLLHPQLRAWFGRMQAIGHGERHEMTADEAIAVARDATPQPAGGSIEAPFRAGQAVLVRTEGANDLPVAGTLLHYDEDGISVARESAAAGSVAVHFPRLGQMLLPG